MKEMWHLRNKSQPKTGIPNLDGSDGARTVEAADSAEVLAAAFSSVSVCEPEGLPDVETPVFASEGEMLTDIFIVVYISHDTVKDDLEILICFKSFGPDGIHPKLLKFLT